LTWVYTPYNVGGIKQNFGRNYSLHLQRKVEPEEDVNTHSIYRTSASEPSPLWVPGISYMFVLTFSKTSFKHVTTDLFSKQRFPKWWATIFCVL